MSEHTLAVIGLIVALVGIIFSVGSMKKVFLMNQNNSDVTVCAVTHIFRVRYIILPIWIRYTIEYAVNDALYTSKITVFSLFGFSDREIRDGISIRYLKSDPQRAEFTSISHGTRMFGWILWILILLGIIGFCSLILLDRYM